MIAKPRKCHPARGIAWDSCFATEFSVLMYTKNEIANHLEVEEKERKRQKSARNSPTKNKR